MQPNKYDLWETRLYRKIKTNTCSCSCSARLSLAWAYLFERAKLVQANKHVRNKNNILYWELSDSGKGKWLYVCLASFNDKLLVGPWPAFTRRE
jgi:hypothetical protein